MTALHIDPNSAEYRESMYVIDEALLCMSRLAGQLGQVEALEPAYIKERVNAISELSALCERLLGTLRHYRPGSALQLAVQYPQARFELKRIRDSFRGRES